MRNDQQSTPSYETLLYATDGAVATITLNRPEHLNTIVPPMPDEVEDSVARATRDDDVKVIVVRGAGRAFCAGYDFSGGFEYWKDFVETDGRWDPGKDFVGATAPQLAPTQKFMSVWRCPKPVIAQVHGWCVGGGQRFRPVRGSGHRQRGRGDRDALQPDVGRLPVRDVDLSARARQGQGARVDGPAAHRPSSGRRSS